MNYKNCASCHQSNPPDMRFCQNCGTEFMLPPNDDLPPTVFGGFNANPQSGQTPPNFQPPNFQPPDFRQPNYQQPNYQQPNFQPPPPVNFQPPHQSAPASGGGQAKKVLLGIGGILIGFIMLASGGVKIYRAFGGQGSKPTPYYSPTPQNLFGGTTNTNRRAATPDSSDLDDYTRRTVGKWSLRETIKGNPQTSGFTGATAENQLKYYDSANNFLHVTMAAFPTEFAAQSNLRSQFQKFKSLNLKVTPESGAVDNNGNEIGIMQTMTSANGKIYTIYWTRKDIVVRVLGSKTDAENFFRAY